MKELELDAAGPAPKLTLLGLGEKQYGEYRLQAAAGAGALNLDLVRDDERRPLAEFKVQEAKLTFRWVAPAEVKTVAEQALRSLRDSVLQVTAGKGEPRNLALREPRLIVVNDNIPLPRQRDLFQKALHVWGPQDKPGLPLYLDSFEIQLEGVPYAAERVPGKDARELEVIPNHEIPGDRVFKSVKIKVEKDKETIWLTVQAVLIDAKPRDPKDKLPTPKEKPKPRFGHVTVKSLVVYTKVDGLQVEVARVGKRGQ
jgi:hypothetical protein